MSQRVGHRDWQAVAAGASVLLLLALALAPRASAELVAGGTTRLRLDRGLFAEMNMEAREGTKVQHGKVRAVSLTLP